jgi:hypothetical protein
MKLRTSGLFDNLRDDCIAAGLEFIGTVFFLLFGLGGIQAATAESTVANRPSSALEQVLYISTCMGLSLLISAWMFFRVTADYLIRIGSLCTICPLLRRSNGRCHRSFCYRAWADISRSICQVSAATRTQIDTESDRK